MYRVPGIHALSRRVYAWIAANRTRLGRRCDDAVCEIPAVNPGSTVQDSQASEGVGRVIDP